MSADVSRQPLPILKHFVLLMLFKNAVFLFFLRNVAKKQNLCNKLFPLAAIYDISKSVELGRILAHGRTCSFLM